MVRRTADEILSGDTDLVAPQEDLIEKSVVTEGGSERKKLPTERVSNRKTAADWLSMTRVETPTTRLQDYLDLDADTVAKIKAQGERGFWEKLGRGLQESTLDTLTELGIAKDYIFPPIGGKTELESLQAGEDTELQKFIGGSPVSELIQVKGAMERLLVNKGLVSDRFGDTKVGKAAALDEKRKIDRDRAIVEGYLFRVESDRIRGTSFIGKIGGGAADMTEFAVAFILTNGLATLSEGIAKKAVGKLIKGDLEKGVKGLFTNFAVGLGRAGARTVAMPQFTTRNYLQKSVDNFELKVSPKGLQIFEGKKTQVSLMTKAFFTTFVQFYGEEALGPVAGKILRGTGKVVGTQAISVLLHVPVPKWVPKGYVGSLAKVFQAVRPELSGASLWTRTGFTGFIDELGEEQLTDILLASLNLESFGKGDDASFLDRVGASIHGFEQLAVNSGVLFFPTVGRLGTSRVINMIEEKKAKQKFKEAPESKVISDEKLNEIVEKLKAKKVKEKEVKEEPTEKLTLEEVAKTLKEEKVAQEKEVKRDISEVSREEIPGLLAQLKAKDNKFLEENFSGEELARVKELVKKADRGNAKAIEELEDLIDDLGEGKRDEFFQATVDGLGQASLELLEQELSSVLTIEDIQASELDDATFKKVINDIGIEMATALRRLGVIDNLDNLSQEQKRAVAKIREIIRQGEKAGFNVDDMIKVGVNSIADVELRKFAVLALAKIKESSKVPIETIKKKPKAKVEEKPKKIEITPAQKAIKEGRAERISEESEVILDKIDKLEKQRSAANRAGRTSKVIEEKIDALSESFDVLDTELSGILSDLKTTVGKGKRLTTTPQKVLTAVAETVRSEKALTKTQIKEVQTSLQNVIKSFNLDPKEALRLSNKIKNVQTKEQLAKVLPIIQKRAEAFLETRDKRRLTSKIKKNLESSKPTKIAGKLQKKSIDVREQRALEVIRKTVKMTRIEADAKFAENQKELDGAELKDKAPGEDLAAFEQRQIELRLENGFLQNASDIKTRSAEELQDLADRIGILITGGRDAARTKMEKESAVRIAKVEASVKVVPEVDKTASQQETLNKKIVKAFRSFGRHMMGFTDIMEVVQQLDPNSKAFEGALHDHTSVTEIEQKVKGDVHRGNQELANAGMEAYGLKTEAAFEKQMSLDSKKIDFGVLKDEAGNSVRIEMSKSEIRKVEMEMRDPDIRQSVEAAEGGYLLGNIEVRGMSQEIQDAIFSELTIQDRIFVSAQMKIYSDLYSRINKQYSKDYGVDLTRNEFYSPIRRSLTTDRVVDSFLNEQGFRNSLNVSFIKGRVKNRELIRVQSDVQAMQSHFAEMMHYINWADKLKDLNAIFGNREMRSRIDANFGGGVNKLIGFYIQKFTVNGKEMAMDIDGLLNRLRINFTRAVLAFKPALTAKQMVSTAAYLEDISTVDFLAGVVEFVKNPFKNKKFLEDSSDLVATRGENIERDIRDSAKSAETRSFLNNPTFDKYMMMTTRWGDKGAILVGGFAHYRAKRKTMSHEDAIKSFEKVTARTQQSSDLSQQSFLQLSNSFTKLFTMFTSSQNQYFRRELAAWRTLIASPQKLFEGKARLTPGEVAKKIAIYHFILPTLFQFVSDGFTWDEDEQLRARWLGSLNGLFIIGDGLDAIIRTSLNIFADTELQEFRTSSAPAIFEYQKDVKKALRKIDPDDIEAEEVWEAMKVLSGKVIGPLSGLPVQRIFDLYEGGSDIIEDEGKKGALKLLGWSPWLVDKQFDEEE